jgi:hypothetical protein
MLSHIPVATVPDRLCQERRRNVAAVRRSNAGKAEFGFPMPGQSTRLRALAGRLPPLREIRQKMPLCGDPKGLFRVPEG